VTNKQKIQAQEQMVYTKSLISGLPYQRPVRQHDVDRIVREWRSDLFDLPVVNYRDGRFFLVDGQHRVAALRQRNGGRDMMILCKVYNGLTYEQEAELVYLLDQSKRPLSAAQSANALLESGSNIELANIQRLMEQNKLLWVPGRCGRGNDGEVTVSRAVINAYRLLGQAAFSRMLCLMEFTWHGRPSSLTAAMFSGMALFLKTYELELDDRLFVYQLSPVNPVEIIHYGKLDAAASGALRYARVIFHYYNAQCGARKLPYKFTS